jgi:hypothetical protein
VRIDSSAARPSEASIGAREAPHVPIVINDQDIQTLEHFFDLLVGHETPDRRQNWPQFTPELLLFR